MGQGEAAEQPAEQSPGQAFWDGELPAVDAEPTQEQGGDAAEGGASESHGNGVVVIDFRGLGPDAA